MEKAGKAFLQKALDDIDQVKIYTKAVQEKKSAVIEIFTERTKNPQQLESLRQKLMKCAFESS